MDRCVVPIDQYVCPKFIVRVQLEPWKMFVLFIMRGCVSKITYLLLSEDAAPLSLVCGFSSAFKVESTDDGDRVINISCQLLKYVMIIAVLPYSKKGENVWI